MLAVLIIAHIVVAGLILLCGITRDETTIPPNPKIERFRRLQRKSASNVLKR
jgi:hypothetical protein